MPSDSSTPGELGARDLLEAILESTADGILVVDNEGRTVYANRRFAEMWSIPQELLDTRSDDQLLEFVLHQLADPEAFLAKVRELYLTSREDLDAVRFKDGRVFERYSRPLLADHTLTGRVWSFRDVTERRRSEEATHEAEAKYRSLIEQIPAITYIDAAEGPETTLYISPQTETLLGYTPQDWMDDPKLLSKRIHPDDRERWQAENARIDVTGEPFFLEYRILTREGRVVWVHDRAVLLQDEGGRPRFWQGVMFDITDRKEAEARLEKLWQQELEAGQRLRALDEMKNTFLQAVSHELRTPLTTILGGALTLERLRDKLSPEETDDLLRRLAANAKKLNRLLSDLLDLDRLARGILEPKIQEADVGELVNGILEESKDLLGDRVLHAEVNPVVLGVEPAKVERIVENLLANTARHTPPDTPVWVWVTDEQQGALIVVEDAGPGIPERVRKTIFEPFQQVGGRQSHAPGVGIGLSLVARFAELHGGRAWVEERPGGGASFRVFLPRAAARSAGESPLRRAAGQ
jgi:PAS domain S-box-containing protein